MQEAKLYQPAVHNRLTETGGPTEQRPVVLPVYGRRLRRVTSNQYSHTSLALSI